MDTSAITAIVGSASALLGTGLGAVIQLRIARASHAFQLRLEIGKREIESHEREKSERGRRLLDAHKAISMISRRFSITGLDIDWRSGMTDKEYDKAYFESCEAPDEVRAICDLFFPEVSEPLEKMHGQMNFFWGNFKEVLRLTELQESYQKKEYFHAQAIAAAQEVGQFANVAKGRLGRLVRDDRR